VWSEVRQADFARKELRDNSYPQREHKEDVRDADMVAARQLVRLSADLIHVEADRKHDGCHAEQHHGNEAEPACKLDDIVLPVAETQQQDGDADAHDARSDEHER